MRDSDERGSTRVRLDKWLWAARFFRTRAQAKQAIDAGRVSVNGSRAKPSRDIDVSCELAIRRGDDEFTVVVAALSDERRSAPLAQLLYTETPASIAAREQAQRNRRAAGFGMQAPPTRPTKKDRRDLLRWQEGQRQEAPGQEVRGQENQRQQRQEQDPT